STVASLPGPEAPTWTATKMDDPERSLAGLTHWREPCRTDGMVSFEATLSKKRTTRPKATRGGRYGLPGPALDCSHLSSRHTSAGGPALARIARPRRFRGARDSLGPGPLAGPIGVSGTVSARETVARLPCKRQAHNSGPVSLNKTTARGPG